LIGFVLASPFSITAAQFFAFAGVAAWVASINRETRIFDLRFPLVWPFAVFGLITLASAFTSDLPLRSIFDSRKLLQILIFYFALNTVRDDWEALWLVKALFAATAVVSAYTLAVALREPIELANRMRGFFSIYMTLGGFLVTAGALALAFLLLPGGGRRSVWIYVAAALMGGALLTTFSRNAWVGMVVALLVIALAGRSGRAASLVLAAAAAAFLLVPQPFRDRLWSMADPKDITTVERIYMWKSGLRMARDHPLLGVGPNRIKKYFPQYAEPEARKRSTSHLHNNPLHIAAERGFPALAAWLWVWGAFFAAVVGRLKEARAGPFPLRFRLVGALAAAAGIFTAGLFEYNFGDSEVMMTTYFAMALPFVGGGVAGRPSEGE